MDGVLGKEGAGMEMVGIFISGIENASALFIEKTLKSNDTAPSDSV